MNKPALALKPVGTNLLLPKQGHWAVELTAPASSVMTDFNERNMVTVSATTPIDDALEVMKHARTRSAFVLDAEGKHVIGFITAYDVLGEKPMLHLQEVGCTHLTCSRDDVQVQHIMDPVERWQVMEMTDVAAASVRGVLDTLSAAGRTHIAVVESDGQGRRLRGAFSSAKLLRLTEEARKRLSAH